MDARIRAASFVQKTALASQRSNLRAKLKGQVTAHSAARAKVQTLSAQLKQRHAARLRPRDLVAAWNGFQLSYLELKAFYQALADAFKQGNPLPKAPRLPAPPTNLITFIAKGNLSQPSKAIKEKVKSISDDFTKTSADMAGIFDLITELKGEGIKVRVDPEAITATSEAALQRIHLTFRAESQESVTVEGKDVDIAK